MTRFCPGERIHERPNNNPVIDGVNSSDQRIYDVWAVSTASASAIVRTNAPAGLAILDDDGITLIPLDSRRISIAEETTVIANALFKYTVTVSYKHVQRDEQFGDELINEDDEKVDFSFSMTNTSFLFGIADNVRFPTEAPDYGRAINVDHEKQIQGVEVPVPQNTFNVRRIFPAGFVTNLQLRLWQMQLGTVNNAGFRGFNPVEVLAVSFSGNQLVDRRTEIVFNFGVQLEEVVTEVNGIELDNGNNYTIAGFEYVWTFSEPGEDPGGSSFIVPRPNGVYISTLFDLSDFSQWGVTI